MKKRVFHFSAEFTENDNPLVAHGLIETKMSPFDDDFMNMIHTSIAEDFKSVCDSEESVIKDRLIVKSLTLLGEETYYEEDRRIPKSRN